MASDSDEDYEHWPELSGQGGQREIKMSVTVPTITITPEDHATADNRDGERYIYKPVNAKSEPKPEAKSEPRAISRGYRDGQLFRYVPAHEIKKSEPKSEPLVRYTYTPPKRKPEPKVWLGRTRAEVAEDNTAIAKRYKLDDAPCLGPSGLKDDDVVWVQDTNNELVPRYYATVKHFDGEWKQYSDDASRWYFVMDT